METYSRTGTGYESCLHIWEFPGSLDDYWLTDICAQENGIVTISIHTDDQAEIKKNLNKAMRNKIPGSGLPESIRSFTMRQKEKMRCRSFTMRSAPWKK